MGKAGIGVKSVTIGTERLAAGMPKIGVVLTGTTRSTLLGQAAQVLSSSAQIVEWRLTTDESQDNRAELINTGMQLRQVLGTIPVIATLKTTPDDSPATVKATYALYLTLVNNRLVDAIELNLASVTQPQFMALTQQMRQQQIRLILSQTYTTATEQQASQIVTDYQAMAAAGADIARVRMQPETATALLTLMAATATAGSELSLPLILTATGSLGRYGAACGQLFGSTIVFGRVGRVGGMGQLPVNQLKQTLQTLATVEGAS